MPGQVRNTNYFYSVAFSAHVAIEPERERQTTQLRRELQARQEELSQV